VIFLTTTAEKILMLFRPIIGLTKFYTIFNYNRPIVKINTYNDNVFLMIVIAIHKY